VLLSFTEEPWEQDLPVRILQVRGLATTPLERATDLRARGRRSGPGMARIVLW